MLCTYVCGLVIVLHFVSYVELVFWLKANRSLNLFTSKCLQTNAIRRRCAFVQSGNTFTFKILFTFQLKGISLPLKNSFSLSLNFHAVHSFWIGYNRWQFPVVKIHIKLRYYTKIRLKRYKKNKPKHIKLWSEKQNHQLERMQSFG